MNYSNENILALILAAGKGTRMKSSKPKVLHEIFGVPLLGWVLKALGNIKPIVVIGHGAEAVEKYMNIFIPRPIANINTDDYVFELAKQNGLC